METPSTPKTKSVAKRQVKTSPGDLPTPPATSSMSGSQKTTSTATPKVTTVSSGNAHTPPSSSLTRGIAKKRKADEVKTIEVSPAAKGKQDDLPPFKTMSPADLKSLLTSAPPNDYLVTNRKYILVDTRDAANFNKCRVKSNHVARFPVSPDAAVQSQEFGSKGAVVNYFLENKADLLDGIQAPGFYNCVVVLNEFSSASGSKLRSFMNALAKWNENTRTSIYLLGGGVQAFSNLYPEQSVFGKVAPPVVVPASCSSTTPTPNNPSSELCLKNLDAMIVTSKVLVKLASKLKSLSSVLSVFREAELEIRKSNVVLKAVMCPACKKIYSGEILLCEKGHSICSECHSRWKELTLCGQDQCGALISGKTRSWSLEQLLAVATYHCDCGLHVTMAESEAHLEECVRNGKDFGRIQQLVSAVHPKMREANKKLTNLRKAMADYDLNYISKVFEDKIPARMGEVTWGIHVGLWAAKEKTVASLREELLSLATNI